MQELTKDDIITQVLTNNYAVKSIEFADGKIKAKLKTIPVGNMLEIENEMSSLRDKSQVYLLHKYGMNLLANSLLEYNEIKFNPSKPQETFKFLETLPSPVVDILTKLRDDFQKEVLKLLVPEELEKHFFPQSSSEEESSSPSEDST